MLRTQHQDWFALAPGPPADAERVREFVAGLSLRSQFLRFFAGVATPGAGLLRSLTGADGRTDVLVAADAAGEMVGHGMAVDRTSAEGIRVSDIGVVVADRWQGRGVGTALIGALAERAAGRGSRELVMDVLPENQRMLAMIDRRWPGARRCRGRDAVTIRAPLTTPAPRAPAGPRAVAVPRAGAVPRAAAAARASAA